MFKEDEFTQKKKPTHHDIGCDLSAISVQELDEKISLLKQEIARIDNEKILKLNSVSLAHSFFKK